MPCVSTASLLACLLFYSVQVSSTWGNTAHIFLLCGGLNEKAPHRLWSLNTGSPGGGTVLGNLLPVEALPVIFLSELISPPQ